MNSKLQTDLLEVAVLTFEELGLMCPHEGTDEQAACGAAGVATSVSFHGVVSGTLALVAYGDVASALATNMLGEDEPPSGEGRLDALGEAANVMCGNLLPRIAGFKEVFHITGPQSAMPQSGQQTATAVAQARLAFDEGDILVRLHLEDDGAAKGLLA
jgi:chemotaxis protein CheY-P-specific phosphatase CheC